MSLQWVCRRPGGQRNGGFGGQCPPTENLNDFHDDLSTGSVGEGGRRKKIPKILLQQQNQQPIDVLMISPMISRRGWWGREAGGKNPKNKAGRVGITTTKPTTYWWWWWFCSLSPQKDTIILNTSKILQTLSLQVLGRPTHRVTSAWRNRYVKHFIFCFFSIIRDKVRCYLRHCWRVGISVCLSSNPPLRKMKYSSLSIRPPRFIPGTPRFIPE